MSMSNGLVAKRYAVALFELAKESGNLGTIEKEVELVKELFAGKQLGSFFSHPKVTAEQKKTMLTESLGAAVSANVLNTLLLMLDRKRGESIAEMSEQFLTLAMEEQQIAEAFVYSVKPLTDVEQEAVSTMIAKKVGKRELRLRNIIKPDLIGGLRIRVGNQIFDGSVSGKLERMKRELIV